MATKTSNNDLPSPVDVIADQFAVELRSGMNPDVESYCQLHPELAERLRPVLSIVGMLEQARSDSLRVDIDAGLGNGAHPAPNRLGDYRLIKRAGSGGMGVVYEAIQESLGRRVAVKTLPLELTKNGTSLERFLREARAVASLHHTNIVPVFAVGIDQGIHYFVMPFIDGDGLDQVLRNLQLLAASEHPAGVPDIKLPIMELYRQWCDRKPATANHNDRMGRSLGTVYWKRVASIGLQVADAIDYAAQQGVLHRDIKPSNLLLDVEGIVWVTDFGLAKSAQNVDITERGEMLGTLRFLAPERLQGMHDIRGDIYGLGLTLYELLTLRSPFDAGHRSTLTQQILNQDPPRPRAIDLRIPKDLETIVLKAIAKQPEHRYQTAGQLAEDLRLFLDDRPIKSRRTSPIERSWRWCRRNPLVASLLAALGAVLVAGFAGVTYQWQQAESSRILEQIARQESDRHAGELRDQSDRMQRAFSMIAEARFCAGQLRWDDSLAAYSAAIELRPDLAVAREERGQQFLDMTMWELAAADIERAFQLRRPLATVDWIRHALLRIQLQDQIGYQKAAGEMLRSFASCGRPDAILDIVRVGVAAPQSGLDPVELVAMSETAAEHFDNPWSRHILAVACYRAGQYARSIDYSRPLHDQAQWSARGTNYPIMAMAQHRLGNDEQAHAALDLATAAFDAWLDEMCPPANSWHHDLRAVRSRSIDTLSWLEFILQYDEARRLLGKPITDDSRFHLLRARGFRALVWQPFADDEYTRALQLRPNDQRIQLEWHRNRAFRLISENDPAGAAAEYGQAMKLMPDDVNLWRFQAIALLAAGDDLSFHQTSRDMIERFAATKDPQTASAVVEICICCPNAVDDWDRILDLVNIASKYQLVTMRRIGAVQFRAGQYQSAVNSFRHSQRFSRLRADDCFLLAMAHDQMGETKESQQRFQQGIDWITQANEKSMSNLAIENRAEWGSWTERPMTLALQREAAAVLK